MQRFMVQRMAVALWITGLLTILDACALHAANEAADLPQAVQHPEPMLQSPQRVPDLKQPMQDSTLRVSDSPQPVPESRQPAPDSQQAGAPPDLPQAGTQAAKKRQLPEGFVYLDEAVPDALFEIRYAGEYNFVGTRIDGYLAPQAIGTIRLAEALQAASGELAGLGYRLLIYDAYRPQKAVQHFVRWSQDEADTAMKEWFYPNEDKRTLFERGYLARKSGHSRGSTVDLTLVDRNTGELVDMGSPFDLLDEISHYNSGGITKTQSENRKLLRTVMERHGFQAYSKEWWHFVLKSEPYPATYFDFDVE
jgi:D-alanyl-D-alanine dipeptidase